MSRRQKQKQLQVQSRMALGLLATVGFQLLAQPASAQVMVTPAQVTPEPNAVISSQRSRARELFKALTSIALPIDDARLKSMEALFNQGKDRDAAAIATGDPLFYDIKVRDLARKMSVREETLRIPTNDFVATFVGIVRDSDTTSAKSMLTGNFVYRADPALAPDVPASEADWLTSNNHYAMIDSKGYSLMRVLKRVDGQRTMLVTGANNNKDTSTGTSGAHPDPAGLLTTRQWVAAHAIGGTNRRMVEFTFREFMCQPISQFADITGPEDRIGRDVDRAPGGDPDKFKNTCKGCHSQQDPLRGAFARVEFNSNQGQPLYLSTVAAKYSNNAKNFPDGYITTDTSWRNNVNAPKNTDAFGWDNTQLSGSGMASFGSMIASSKGFSRCMVRHVFSAVCKRDVTARDETLIRKLGDDFENDSYHMRRLFQSVALRPECLGNI